MYTDGTICHHGSVQSTKGNGKILLDALVLTSMEFSMRLSHTRWGTEKRLALLASQCQPFNENCVFAGHSLDPLSFVDQSRSLSVLSNNIVLYAKIFINSHISVNFLTVH
jgi:hypothetical protein